MRILVIDHIYHKETKSSDLLDEILGQFECHIEKYYLDPNDLNNISSDVENIITLASDDWDAVFLWQIDYLGSYFSQKGHKVFIFPM